MMVHISTKQFQTATKTDKAMDKQTLISTFDL